MMQAQKNEFSEDPEFSLFSTSPAIWKLIVSAVQILSEDVSFDLDADGLRTRAMDDSHVALLDVKFPSTSFERFQCLRPAKFTVHVEDFSKIVKRAEPKETFELSRTKTRSLAIKIGSGHYRKEFEMHLLDEELKASPLPRLTFTTRFSMGLDAFYQILVDISTVSTHVTVSVANGLVCLSGKGDSGKAEVTIGKGDGALLQEAVVETGSAESTRAVYNLEYPLKIVKAVSSFSDLVKFEYSTKMPLRLEFLSLEHRSAGPVQFYLAPKMID
jgi:proliferating cell nuclear antigen